MPVETDADRAIFVDADEFGAACTWNRAGSDSVFSVIFDEEYQLLTAELLDAGVEGSGPQIQCRTSDLPSGAAQGDAVSIDGTGYVAVEIKPDGTGMTVVRLQEA